VKRQLRVGFRGFPSRPAHTTSTRPFLSQVTEPRISRKLVWLQNGIYEYC